MQRRHGYRRRLAGAGAVALAALVACSAPSPVGFPDGPADTVTAAAPDTAAPLTFRGRDLIDADGRVVQLHGINMVLKRAPWFLGPGEPWLEPSDLEVLRRTGFNAVRLGVWAAALMPEPGVVDHQYIENVASGVELLSDAGMWVMLDFHQDVFSGMPDWATTPEAAAQPLLPPDLAEVFWALSYFSPRSNRQWEDLYARVPVADGRSAVDLLGDGWAAVAERFRDTPNVIGIDLLNEPWPAERFFDCLVGGCGSRYAELQAIYEDLTARIGQVAPDLPVWWAPFNWGPPFQGTPAPGAGVGYTFHSYCLDTDGGEPVQPDTTSNTLCRVLYDGAVADALVMGARWNAPVVLGEFGASRSPLNTTRLTQLADEHLLSWIYWDYPYFEAAADVVRTDIVRAYAQATAGTPTMQRFDPATGRFEYRFRPDPSATGPTSIALPPDVYPQGYTATVDGGTVTSAPDDGRLTVEAGGDAVEVVVRVERVTD
jgi:endoglycosylceramidase